jgi:hypothetical protein
VTSRLFRSNLYWVPDADSSAGHTLRYLTYAEDDEGLAHLSAYIVAGDKDDICRAVPMGIYTPAEALQKMRAFERENAMRPTASFPEARRTRLAMLRYFEMPHYAQHPLVRAENLMRERAAQKRHEEDVQKLFAALRRRARKPKGFGNPPAP